MSPFDYDSFVERLQKWNVETERQTAEIEAMLTELDPDWRERAAEESRAKSAAKQERKSKPIPKPISEETDMPKSNLVDSDVMDILKQARCDGCLLYLPPAKLERGLYERTNEVLTRIGGHWKGGKTAAHVFDDPCQPLLDEVLATGVMPLDNPLDFYATPETLAYRMAKMVDGGIFLEPSAGTGTIVRALLETHPGAVVDAIETDPKRAEKLRSIPGISNLEEGDFMTSGLNVNTYDGIVMNPPFTVPGDKQAYITHILRAYSLVKPGGTVVGITPASVEFRSDKRTETLKSLIAQVGIIERLPAETFKASGTNVATCLVTLRKPV